MAHSFRGFPWTSDPIPVTGEEQHGGRRRWWRRTVYSRQTGSRNRDSGWPKTGQIPVPTPSDHLPPLARLHLPGLPEPPKRAPPSGIQELNTSLWETVPRQVAASTMFVHHKHTQVGYQLRDAKSHMRSSQPTRAIVIGIYDPNFFPVPVWIFTLITKQPPLPG